jgi:hypothetical protein
MKIAYPAVLAVLLNAGSAIAAPADEKLTTLGDQREVAVTIYNDDLALIKDQRKVALDNGLNHLAWRDVSARMRPETALLRNLGAAKGFSLLEQNFDFDLLTPAKLLEKYVGKQVTVIKTNPATGAETREVATVLATTGGTVLKFADHIETGVPGRLAFAAVPDNLRDQPTLVMSVLNPNAGAQTLELSYLTGGLSWRADYVAELSDNDTRMDLNGWVTLTNQSGARFPNAKLQLVAGDVNRVREQMRPSAMAVRRDKGMVAEAAPMAQENLFEYHLYTLNRPTTLAEQQTKQVALLSATQIPVIKTLELRGAAYYYQGSYGDLGQKLKASVYVTFDNKGGGLGVPLPKGVMRLYAKDSAGNAQFIGEDSIDHTPKNETVRLKMGEAFDVTADRKQTDFQKLSGSGKFNYVSESAYQITLKNAKNQPVVVNVFEPMPGDWQVLSESSPHSKESASTAQWKISVPAGGKAMLTYRVRVKY